MLDVGLLERLVFVVAAVVDHQIVAIFVVLAAVGHRLLPFLHLRIFVVVVVVVSLVVVVLLASVGRVAKAIVIRVVVVVVVVRGRVAATANTSVVCALGLRVELAFALVARHAVVSEREAATLCGHMLLLLLWRLQLDPEMEARYEHAVLD